MADPSVADLVRSFELHLRAELLSPGIPHPMCKIGHGIPGQVCANWLACQDRDERQDAAQFLQDQDHQQLLGRLPVLHGQPRFMPMPCEL
jgi:hypothetical protein